MREIYKKYGYILIGSFFISAPAQTIEPNEGIQIKDLEMPNAPALTLLDQTTTNIETPKNLQALTVTLINSIDNNIGLEINPYMILTTNKSFYDFYNVKWDATKNSFKYQGWFTSVVKDFTLSFAKVKKDSTSHFSIGGRTNLIRIIGNEKKYIEKLNEMENLFIDLTNNTVSRRRAANEINQYRLIRDLGQLSTATQEKIFVTLIENDLISVNNKFNENNTDVQVNTFTTTNSILFAEFDFIRKQRIGNETIWQIINRLREWKKLSDENDIKGAKFLINEDAFRKEFATNLRLEDALDKPIFTLDAAAAYSHFYPSDTFSEGQMGKFGVWSTANLNIKIPGDSNKQYISFYGYARYIKDNAYLEKDTNEYTKIEYFDFGTKVEFEYYKLTFAYEYINRTKEEDNYRSVGSIKYKYNDTIMLNGGFGKNLEQTDNLVSFLGVSWGIESNNKFSTKLPK
ncbi:MAG: hypothetical protein ABWY22_13480 [Flavobacterium sp.]